MNVNAVVDAADHLLFLGEVRKDSHFHLRVVDANKLVPLERNERVANDLVVAWQRLKRRLRDAHPPGLRADLSYRAVKHGVVVNELDEIFEVRGRNFFALTNVEDGLRERVIDAR